MRLGNVSRPADSRAGKALELWAWLLVGAALYTVYVFICETLAGPTPYLWFFFSSDTVQYGLLYRDLFEDGFHFAGWNISHAPEYVQMLWALLIRGLAGTLTRGHVWEAMSQPVLLALALRFVLSRLSPRASVLGPLVVTLVLTAISRGKGLDFIAFVWSNRHGFTAILAAIGLGALIDVLRTGRSAVLLFIVVAAGVASDLLFIAWFVGPAIAAVVAQCWTGDRARSRQSAASLAAGALLGWFAFWLITPVTTVGAKVELQMETFWGALNRMADVAFKSSPEQAAFALVMVASLLIAAGAALRSSDLAHKVAAAYVVALNTVTVLAVAATGAPFREVGYTRYLLAPELAGLVVILAALGHALGRKGIFAVAFATSALVLPSLRPLPRNVPPAGEFYPPLVQCLDGLARQHRLSHGVADYWLAKYVTALSRADLRVVSVTPRLDPFVNFTNIEWFLGGVGAQRHNEPLYTFAILGAARPEDAGVSPVALAALGQPQGVENCAGFEVRILPPGADARIKDQFRANRRIQDYYKRRSLPLPQ